MVPREELHTCHKRKKSEAELEVDQNSSVLITDDENHLQTSKATMSGINLSREDLADDEFDKSENFVAPALPNYFNSLDENNRLQFAKERCL